MRIRQKYRNDLEELVARLVAARVSSAGEPSRFDALQYDFIVSVLDSAIDFQPVIPDVDRRPLIHRAVMAMGQETKPDSGILEKHLKLSEVNYLQKPLHLYVLATGFGRSGPLLSS